MPFGMLCASILMRSGKSAAVRRHWLSADGGRFWWLDLNTWIMEHSYSLQEHIFDNLNSHVYRDINEYNPLNISHPPTAPYLDAVSLSANGDQDPSSIQILISQDCGGFSLGSFFARRSVWTDRLLDTWWDPVMYEQMHMEWEHGEQNSLEYLYEHQPSLRSGVAFLPQRHANAYPPGACGDELDAQVHYLLESRDFLVNMAGCQFGRDCWGEMFHYRELSKRLDRSWWQRVTDGVRAVRQNLFGEKQRYTRVSG
jgi:mannan polymerase II complex MNN10 subunit